MKNIDDTRLYCFKRDAWRCVHCGKYLYTAPQRQLAHKIKKSKYNLKKYGAEIIHHPMNMDSTCSLSCNAKSDLGVKDELIKHLVKKIREDLDKLYNM